MTYPITIFQNIKETTTPYHVDVSVSLDRIKTTGASKELVKRIRKEKDKSKRNELKKMLPAICFSGTFNKRVDTSLTEHSGLICLDFDGYPKVKTMLDDKAAISKNPYVFAVFISPSGNGLKVLVKIPKDKDNHVNYFQSLQKHFNSEYFDTTSKNLSRVCYESYDPLLYSNPDSKVWDEILEIEYKEVKRHVDPLTIPITDENKIVEILVRWWEKKFPMSEGQRNQNTYVLAAAFNDYGVHESLASHILSQYATRDFNNAEIQRTIKSAYANTTNFGTKYYEDNEKITDVKNKLRQGVPKNEIRCQLENADIDTEIINSVLERADEDNKNQVFWVKSNKGVIKIVHILFKQYLEDNGFYKYCPEGGKNYVFVKVSNNLIDHTSEKEIKDFILNSLLKLEDLTIYNYFADHTRFFKEEFLSLLSTIDIYFIEDTKHEAYLYYRNCAVKVTRNEIIPIDYIDLGGYVWKEQVIDRIFTICKVLDCDYKQFVSNICANDVGRVATMESTIGYLMHGYKNLSNSPAVILNDEIISDNPEGGTGKGLFMNALQQMKKLVFIDGKSFNFERSFAYQTVSADTQILCFDDVKKHFEFERLFSVITEGLTLEKKNRDAISIPFKKSPKIAITTNYALKGSGNSHSRRKWEIELNQHYNKNYSPLDEFNKLMFGDWDDAEWCVFDNYMVYCLQLHLNEGLIKSNFVNLAVRHLSAETSHEFIEWCGLLKGQTINSKLMTGKRIYKNYLYQEFIEENPDYAPKSKMTISRTRFNKWLAAFALFYSGQTPVEGRDMNGRWIIIKDKVDPQADMDF